MSNEDEDIIEPFAVQEIHLDGFSGVHVYRDSLRCTAFSMQDGRPVAVVKLIMSSQTARHFCVQASEALGNQAKLRVTRNRRKPG